MSMLSHLNPAWFEAPDGGDLDRYIQTKVKEIQKVDNVSDVSVLIVPHAGYAYSLDIAIQGYAQLDKNNYDRVLILSPSHAYPFLGKVGIEPVGRIASPTGEISFDENFSLALKKIPEVQELVEASSAEHSIHIQLPLIRSFLGDIPVAALMFGKWHYNKSLENFAQNIYSTLDSFEGGIKRTLIIVSSDFTHYGATFNYLPFESDIKKNIDELDHTIFHAFASQDIALFEKVIARTRSTVCGATAIKFLLALLPDKARFKEIAYTTSGELLGDFSTSVSYLSALVSADWSKGFSVRLQEEEVKSRFSLEEQEMILDIAKASLDFSVRHGKQAQINYDTIPPLLMENGAVFVTLEKNGMLRGCIGDILPQRPLVDAILTRAYSAALEDDRFPKVTLEELPFIDVEVSVLSLPIPVANYKDIKIGTHGIILQKGINSAVFLPQVAKEQGWSLDETLYYLAEKSGLELESLSENWKDECVFYVFTSEIFRD